MMLLFVSFFFASVGFIAFFLMNLQDDIKRESIIPLFKIIPALAFWIFTLPAFLAPEASGLVTTLAYNVIVSGGVSATIQNPVSIINTTTSGLPVRAYKVFFYPWLAILTMILFLILIWYVTMLRQKTRRLLKEGSGALAGFEKQYGET